MAVCARSLYVKLYILLLCALGLLLFTPPCVELVIFLESLLDHKDLHSPSFLEFVCLANSPLDSASAPTLTINIFLLRVFS